MGDGQFSQPVAKPPLWGFHIRCSDGSRTFCLLCTDIDFFGSLCLLGLGSMSVHIRQPVREQPDTGYWNPQRGGFATGWLNLVVGMGVIFAGGFLQKFPCFFVSAADRMEASRSTSYGIYGTGNSNIPHNAQIDLQTHAYVAGN